MAKNVRTYSLQAFVVDPNAIVVPTRFIFCNHENRQSITCTILTFSDMMSFIGSIYFLVVIKLLIYFNSHMRITEQIINLIHKWFHVFIQDRGRNIHKDASFVSFPEIIRKTAIYRHWLYLISNSSSSGGTQVTLTQAGYWFILRFCEHHFTYLWW
jgi:hypothetical protein